jgi:hypothetical protein
MICVSVGCAFLAIAVFSVAFGRSRDADEEEEEEEQSDVG